METKTMRVFHGLVNYGTQSGLFARELRNSGVDAISVTSRDAYSRITDVVLRAPTSDSMRERVAVSVTNNLLMARLFFKHNVFHFYFGTRILISRFAIPFWCYRILHKKLVFHYLGVDVQLYQASIDKYETTNVRFYIKHGSEHDRRVIKRLRLESKYADLQLVCAPYLSEFVQNSIVLPLALDLEEYAYCPKTPPQEEVVIMHAPTNRDNKGTSHVLRALDRLIKEGYRIRVLLVEGVSHHDLKERYKECDIFVDQLLGGWYGTASIEAMAIGRPTVCCIREDYFQYVDYAAQIPIIPAWPNTIYSVLKDLLGNTKRLPDLGETSRAFVEQVHDLKKITNDLLSLYENLR